MQHMRCHRVGDKHFQHFFGKAQRTVEHKFGVIAVEPHRIKIRSKLQRHTTQSVAACKAQGRAMIGGEHHWTFHIRAYGSYSRSGHKRLKHGIKINHNRHGADDSGGDTLRRRRGRSEARRRALSGDRWNDEGLRVHSTADKAAISELRLRSISTATIAASSSHMPSEARHAPSVPWRNILRSFS